MATMIKGKSPEEIERILTLEDQFTPEQEEQIRKEQPWPCSAHIIYISFDSIHIWHLQKGIQTTHIMYFIDYECCIIFSRSGWLVFFSCIVDCAIFSLLDTVIIGGEFFSCFYFLILMNKLNETSQ
uniref:Skp1 domain-containing protein n=1 Tax=Ascaris lumbricoides TaxID=6252 RepID=A0A0M3HL51_ASCLU